MKIGSKEILGALAMTAVAMETFRWVSFFTTIYADPVLFNEMHSVNIEYENLEKMDTFDPNYGALSKTASSDLWALSNKVMPKTNFEFTNPLGWLIAGVAGTGVYAGKRAITG